LRIARNLAAQRSIPGRDHVNHCLHAQVTIPPNETKLQTRIM
jgi:hypothetical protein